MLLTAALATRLPLIVVDTSTEGFLKATNPAIIDYQAFRHEFGQDDAIVLAVETDDVFSAEVLNRLRDLHDDLEASIPFLDEVTSLVNARSVRGQADELVVEDLMVVWPETAADIEALRARVLANPLYINTLITSDARMTTLEIKLEPYVETGATNDGLPDTRVLAGSELERVVAAVDRAVATHSRDGFRILAAGTPYMITHLATTLMNDTRRLVSGVVIAIALLLAVLFGRARATFLSLLVVSLSVVCTMGILVLLGMPFQAPTQAVPISLLAIGIGDSVHILAIYYQQRRRRIAKTEAIAAAIGDTGLAVLMTSLTTAGAMMSFVAASLAPIANLGVLIPIGVMIAFALTMTVLPALLAILPERENALPTERRLAGLDRAIVAAGTWSVRHPWPVLAATTAVVAVFALAARDVRVAHNPLSWFPPEDPVRIGTETLNARFGGVVSIETVLDTKRDGGIQEPEFLRALERAAEFNATLRAPADRISGVDLRIGKTVSVADMIKEINRALNENREEAYRLPDSAQTVAQELLLFELSGNDDLEDLTDYRYRSARLSMRVPWVDANSYGGFLDALRAGHNREFADDVKMTVTGRMAILSATFTQVVTSMVRSYVLAFVAVTPLMILVLGQVRLGLLAMIPNLLPVLAALAFMGFCDIPLDVFTLLSGSIILGLAVDDTIHFMHGYRTNYERSGDTLSAVEQTLTTTGQALFFTTLVLCAGYGVYMFAYMQAPVTFGMTVSGALIVALLADIMVAPALLSLVVSRDRA